MRRSLAGQRLPQSITPHLRHHLLLPQELLGRHQTGDTVDASHNFLPISSIEQHDNHRLLLPFHHIIHPHALRQTVTHPPIPRGHPASISLPRDTRSVITISPRVPFPSPTFRILLFLNTRTFIPFALRMKNFLSLPRDHVKPFFSLFHHGFSRLYTSVQSISRVFRVM